MQRLLSLFTLLLLALGSVPAALAAPVTVEQLLMDLNDDAKLQADLNVKSNRFTRVREAGELTVVDVDFTIVGGGSLVLCERGHFQAQGVCDSAQGVSDVMSFVAGESRVTLYSDADDGTGLAVLGLDLSNETLINRFGSVLRFVEEGTLFDERGADGPFGQSMDLGPDSNVSIYVFRAGKGFHAFVVHSDTNEAPEPATILLFFAAALSACLIRRGGSAKSRVRPL